MKKTPVLLHFTLFNGYGGSMTILLYFVKNRFLNREGIFNCPLSFLIYSSALAFLLFVSLMWTNGFLPLLTQINCSSFHPQ